MDVPRQAREQKVGTRNFANGGMRAGSDVPSQPRPAWGRNGNVGSTRANSTANTICSPALQRLIGESPVIREIRTRIQQLAGASLPLSIIGETGTGKEVCTVAIHQLSGRHPLVVVNCAAIAPTLIDSELFGYEKGAYTGATRDHKGLIAAANGGTLVLDELTELDAAAQAKLLRAVESGEYRPVGSTATVKSRFRLLASTNSNIDALAACGRFRWDLLYRLGSARIVMPPLRERPEDIPLLAHDVLQQCRRESGYGPTRLSSDALSILMQQAWPGNVRELLSEVRLAAVLAGRSDVIEVEHLSRSLRSAIPPDPAPLVWLPFKARMQNAEAKAFRETLERTAGNHKQAALLLKIKESTYYRRLAALEMQIPGFGELRHRRKSRQPP